MSLNEARQYYAATPQRRRRSEPSQQPKKLVKIKSRKITTGEKFLAALFGIVVSVVMIYIVSFSANLDSLNRDLQRLEQEVNEQQTVNANLDYQVMEYSNPERILNIAKENGLNIQNTKIKQATQIEAE
ncbi:cell division protein FtsL [Amphibacillus cookii]|uniref:cell division protein FtsL n=1 Tax=Amphibacillus cookii TaxID=767787 RepID=UPI00195C374D|nr:cell division protein FtsL [Amphibacillus cookii]MBM7540472.1 cell division protein FtsL [Amphibacillus cookii]